VLRYIRAYAVAGDPNAERQEYARKLTRLLNPAGKDQLTPFLHYSMGAIKKEDLVNMLTVRKKQKAYDAMTPDEKEQERISSIKRASQERNELARVARERHLAYQSSQPTTSEPLNPEPMTQDELAQAARASHDRYQNGQ
jgi:hypothetical protein